MAARKFKDERSRLLAAVQAKWANIYPYAHDDRETVREARLNWIRDHLRLPALKSMTELTDKQIKLVLVLMDRPGEIKRAEELPPKSGGGGVHHLATEHQAWAITVLFEHLRYDQASREAFLKQRFGRVSERWLTPKQAGSAIQSLLYRAAYRRVRAERVSRGDPNPNAPITQQEKNRTLPAIRRELGIGGK